MGYKAVDYSRMTPVLIEAVKEQQKKISDLESQNQRLAERLAELEVVVKSLATQMNSSSEAFQKVKLTLDDSEK